MKEGRMYIFLFSLLFFCFFSVLSELFDVEFDCKIVFARTLYCRPASKW